MCWSGFLRAQAYCHAGAEVREAHWQGEAAQRPAFQRLLCRLAWLWTRKHSMRWAGVIGMAAARQWDLNAVEIYLQDDRLVIRGVWPQASGMVRSSPWACQWMLIGRKFSKLTLFLWSPCCRHPEACFQRFPALVELSQEHFLQRLWHTKLDILFKILVNCVWKSSCPLTISQLLLCPRIFWKYSTVSQKWCRSEKPLLHHLLHVISSWRLCCLAVAVCKRMVGIKQARTYRLHGEEWVV